MEKLVTSKDIGDKIRKRRTELGFSQEKLAEAMDVTYQQVQRYENGASRLNIENIQVLAKALSLPLSYLLEYDTEKPLAYLPADELKLLDNFRKTKSEKSRNIIMQLAEVLGQVDEKDS